MKKLLTGNEAIARGAYEAGVRHASAYPGTPSTEILENIAKYDEIYAEWAPNEKVAMESAIGASMAGVRSMASMKHVGVNVAADPIMTYAYMGVNGGTVLISADEPGMFSSQNEQDNRNYAKHGKFPMMEPADSQECLDMMKAAFDLSEEFNVLFMIRLVTRVCHSKSIVELGERNDVDVKPWEPNPMKYVALPAHARILRVEIEKRTERLREFSETCPYNRVEMNDKKIGIISSGPSYYYAKEVFGEEASYLKLGFTWPLPPKKITEFCNSVDEVYIVEEDDPYIEDFVRSLGFKPHGKDLFPPYGEMLPGILRKCLNGEELPSVEYAEDKVIKRPPTLCSGCPHRGFFYRLGKRKDIMISGDIGCYTLAAGPPYNAMNSCVCMGASFSVGHGAQQAFDRAGVNKRVVAVLGDSTFFHTGINSLLNTVYNKSRTISVILDNRITAMTGHQNNPGSGFTAKGEPAGEIQIEPLVKAMGIKHVRVVDPNDLDAVDKALDELIAIDEASVLITRWPCVLKKFSEEDINEFEGMFSTKNFVNQEVCIGCRKCQKTGCPSLEFQDEKRKMLINPDTCVGCDVCMQVCPVQAIQKKK